MLSFIRGAREPDGPSAAYMEEDELTDEELEIGDTSCGADAAALASEAMPLSKPKATPPRLTRSSSCIV